MNRYLYLVFFFIIASFSNVIGQQLSVKSFRALPNDMDARQNYKTMDQNGELCAIIKVVTSEKGFQFDIGSLGITKTVQKTGEIWLYVPHGARRVSIFHESLGVLRDYQFPEKIDEGVCYELVLVSGKTVTTVVANEIESQWLIITSDPTGADVFINDEPAGVTPYQNLLPVGKYNYRLQKTLYLNSAGVVELVSGGQKQKINAKLEPNFGTIDVTSSPERGASVLLDGVETGKTTPCTFERLPVGEHTLTVSLEMYATATQKVAVKAGPPQSVNIVMRPAFAEVAVKTTPKGDIYINNALKGTGEWKGRLIPGLYNFEARLDKHISATEQRTVVIGQPLELTLQPIPRTGSLNVMSNPIEATIRILGKDYGTTPNTIKNLLIGDYTVELSLPGYATAFEKVNITEGATSTINATLQNGREVTISSTPAGVDLYVDDKWVGTTPYKGSLTFGAHKLSISKDGKKSEKQVNIAQAGGESSFTLTLQTGREVTISSTPAGVDLYVDDKWVGTTPYKGSLTFGAHKLSISKDGKKSEKQVNIAQAGGESSFTLTLQTKQEINSVPAGGESSYTLSLKNRQKVIIFSTPVGVDLYVDDKWVGTTPYKGFLTFGMHKLSISKDGKKSEKLVNIAQAGGESSFTLTFGPESFKETVNGVSFDMIAIDGGSFMMGSNDGEVYEKPVHRVTVSDFYMGKTEVTQALWKAVMGNYPSRFIGDNLPVENISWDDAQEFIKKLNRLTGKKYRLPTEAEWEYAAGGGSTNRTKWAGTDEESSVTNYAWYKSNYVSRTHEVATKLPNSLGLYDMTGNVWEWCNDLYGSYSSNDQVNPTGASSGLSRVGRGGSWNYGLSGCRVAIRSSNPPGIRNNAVGLRLCLIP